MRTLASFIPDNIINALGWTIFHSLWQGLIIGLILLLIFKYRRGISSQTKYLLGIFAMAAIFISALFTFLVAYHPLSSHVEMATFLPSGVTSLAGIPEAGENQAILNPGSSGWQNALIRTFDIVSIIWFTGVLLLALRLAGGMLVINGMRRQGVAPLPEVWEKKMHMLALKTGLRRTVTYLQSQKVLVPMVVGIWRPVVLIPSMIISGLPADQLETIIVHELGHIRRHDFLINIIQSVIEALFFYHPVVWVISENVRQERENCCDDYTIKVCGKVSHYARALAHLSELQIKAVLPSVAITGNKKSILHRVERLINNKKMKTNKTERLIAGLVLVTSVLVITLSTGATFKPSGFAQQESQIVLPFLDKNAAVPVTDPEPVTAPAAATAPAPVTEDRVSAPSSEVSEPSGVSPITPPAASSASANISLPSPAAIPAAILTPPTAPADTAHRHHRDKIDVKNNTVTREFHNKDGEDHEMKFVIKQGKVKELYVDGRRIPENEFSTYQQEIDVTLEDLQDMENDLKHAKEELEHVDFDKIREDIHIEMQHFKEHEMQDLQKEMQKLQEEQIKVQIDKEEMRREIEEAMVDVRIDQEKMRKEMQKAQEEIKKAMEEYEDGTHKLSEEEFEQAMEAMERGLFEAQEGMAMLEKENMQKIMDEALASVEEIDQYKIQQEIEEAMKKIQEIDFAEIEKEMQFAMQNMEHEKLHMEKEKQHIDEMIEELEKLELDKK